MALDAAMLAAVAAAQPLTSWLLPLAVSASLIRMLATGRALTPAFGTPA
jgi:hypothetical protein